MLREMALKLGRDAGKHIAGKQGEALTAALDDHLLPALLKAARRRLDAAAVAEGMFMETAGTISGDEFLAWSAELDTRVDDSDPLIQRIVADLQAALAEPPA